MVRRDIYQQAAELTNKVFEVTSGLDLPHGDSSWSPVVTVFLTQANERLDSVRVLLDKNYCESAEILTRSLFELAANLAYIAKDTTRLPQYLKHGGIPTTSEEVKRLQEELQSGGQPKVKDIVPGRAWKRLKDMCTDLGSNWLAEYETFYRYISVPTHAGSFTLGENYIQLSAGQPPSAHKKAAVLITALAFHLRVAETTANTFPKQMDIKNIVELHQECSKFGGAL